MLTHTIVSSPSARSPVRRFLHEQPPALQGSPAVEAADRVIRRAMATRAGDRYADGAAMAAALAGVSGTSGTTSGESATPVAALTRIVVLPFRILRPDPETDFLGFSLADAVSTSLSSLPSVVVRSSAVAGAVPAERPDLRRPAADVDVDLVLLGTHVRAGAQIRASAQVVETPAGTVVGAITAQAPVDDLFRLEDELSRKVADAIAPRLAAPGERMSRGVPQSARAYELFLRGNELARSLVQTPLARDMYLACLDEDPDFAPAWARLGRAYRVIGKYIEDRDANRVRAEQALRRALELDGGRCVAHQYLARASRRNSGGLPTPRASTAGSRRFRSEEEAKTMPSPSPSSGATWPPRVRRCPRRLRRTTIRRWRS